jgi:membrane-associated protease RseP (regulator of RpoE activity)
MADYPDSDTISSLRGFSNPSLGDRAVICAAGPGLNLLFAAACCGLWFTTFGEGPLLNFDLWENAFAFLGIAGGFSFGMALFNLIPIPPLDGGRLLLFGIEAFTRKSIPDPLQKNIHFAGMITIVIASIISALFLTMP